MLTPANLRRLFSRALRALAALAVAWAFFSMPATFAQNVTWVGNTSTNWNTASNWNPHVPVSSNNPIINTNSGNQPVLSSGNFIVANLTVGSDSSSGSNTLLTISNGGNLTSIISIIGKGTGSTGSALVSGSNSISTIFQNLTVGNLGAGNLTITNGGNVTSGNSYIGANAGSNGTVSVSDVGSNWVSNSVVTVGLSGNGNLNISNGGNVGVLPGFLSSLILGQNTGSNGTVTISGANSTLVVSALNVGNSGTGTLNIGNGAFVTVNGSANIGTLGAVNQTGGLIIVSGNSSGGIIMKSPASYNLSGGTLQLGGVISGNGTLKLSGGTFMAGSGDAIAVNTTLVGGTNSTILVNGSITWSNVISGSGNLQIGRNTSFTPLANNTYTGATIINGNVFIRNPVNGGVASQLGASSSNADNLIIDGGTLTLGGFLNVSTDRLFTIGPNGTTISSNNFQMAFTNTGALAFSAASGTPATLTLDTFGMVTFAPSIGDNGPGGVTSVNLIGFSNWTLTNNNTYSGNTIVNDATLNVKNVNGSATGSGTVTVNGALGIAGHLNGNGTIAGNVIINTGASIFPGYQGVGTLTVGGISLAADSYLTFILSSNSSNNQIAVTNSDGLTINGGELSLIESGTGNVWATLGNYTLMTYNGNIGGAGLGAFTVNNPQPGLTYDFSANGSAVQLTIANLIPPNSWGASGNGAWDTAANWQANVTPDGAQAIIGFTNATAPTSVTLDTSHTAGYLYFNSPDGDFGS